MEVHIGQRLSQDEVLCLLEHFDTSSDIPLSKGLDFLTYSKKLSDFAYFVIAEESNKQVGFLAYYLNTDGKFIYVPQIVVHKDGRHRGVGHLMFSALYAQYASEYNIVKLEVLKENLNARDFYSREGFSICEDHRERLLLKKDI